MNNNHIPILLNITHISFIFFLIIIVTTFLPLQSHSQQSPPGYKYLYSSCRHITNSYNCGKLTNISYPFWGQNRHYDCGAGKPFFLNCHNNTTTTILLSSQNFTVLEIDKKNHIIKLKRTDLSQNLCSPQFDDTYLSPTLFQYLTNVNNITIFYNCSSIPSQNSLCRSQNHAFAHVYEEDILLEESDNCKRHIQVPVGEGFPIKNGYIYYNNHDDLETGLNKGFGVKYSVNEKCLGCLGSEGGVCSSDYIDNHVELCYYDNCSDGSIAPSTHCSAGKWNSTKTLIVGVASAVFVALAVMLAIYIYKRRKNRSYAKSYVQSHSLSSDPSSKDLERGSQHFGGSQNFGVQHFTYSELEEATNYFDPSKELGEGGFGTVYYGKLHDGRSVAVKRLYENNYKRVEQFMNEVKILAGLVHPNLVSLYGCTSRHSRELLLVYEYVSNGTVADHLRGKQAKHGKFSWDVRLNIAVETASALKYLHVSDIIHRDIKTNNILLDTYFRVKVADFGLSRLFPYDQTHVSTAPQGTPGYVDPEYHQCYQLTDKSDVYSFGVVMIELISTLPAVDITRHRHEINLANMAINRIQNQALHELVDPSLGFDSNSKVKKEINAVAELAFQCLQSSKDMRPCMDEVLEALKDIQSDGKHKSLPEVMDISSLADDVVLLNHDPPPLSPDSNVLSNSTTSNASG